MRAIAGRWAVAMTGRGIETMRPALHASDVGRLLADLPGGAPPPDVHDPVAFAAARRAAWVRIATWCPSPERLVRWCVVVARRYAPYDVAGYLVAAARRGDAGTVLSRAGQGERVLARADEQALRGEHAGAVAALVGATAAVLGADDVATRDRLRAELRVHLRAGRMGEARRVLLRLLGPDRSDVALSRATAGICSLAAARRVSG